MHLKLKAILDATSASRDFERNIREFEGSIADLIEDNIDASLFVLVQMLYEKNLTTALPMHYFVHRFAG